MAKPQREWSNYSEQLLTLWQLQLQSQSNDHLSAAKWCSAIHYACFILSSVMGTAASAALWAQVGKMLGGSSSEALTIAIACVATAATAIGTVSTVLGLNKKSIMHRTSAYQFDTLARTIQAQLVLDASIRGDMEVFVKTTAGQYQLINSHKPLWFLSKPGETLPNLSLINMVAGGDRLVGGCAINLGAGTGTTTASTAGTSAASTSATADESRQSTDSQSGVHLVDISGEPGNYQERPGMSSPDRELQDYASRIANPALIRDMQKTIDRLVRRD